MCSCVYACVPLTTCVCTPVCVHLSPCLSCLHCAFYGRLNSEMRMEVGKYEEIHLNTRTSRKNISRHFVNCEEECPYSQVATPHKTIVTNAISQFFNIASLCISLLFHSQAKRAMPMFYCKPFEHSEQSEHKALQSITVDKQYHSTVD